MRPAGDWAALGSALAAEGAWLVISSFINEAMERAAAEISTAHSTEVSPVTADVSQPGKA
jgi:hypothetical protein